MDDLYDEFGNYIGDGGDSDDESIHSDRAPSVRESSEEIEASRAESDSQHESDVEMNENAIVLHEDKVYYPNASEVYGEDVETLVQDRDTQPLSQPIIDPVKAKSFVTEERDLPKVQYSREFHASLLSFPEQVRNVAIVGHLNHGKTSLLDMLITETHELDDFKGRKENEQLRYTDTHAIETARGISIKSAPVSLLLTSGKEKSHVFNIIDTPGHVDFMDEVVASARLVDGLIIVVDAVEGMQVNTKRVLDLALKDNLPFIVVVNKVDRLILDLRLPPTDAYLKLVKVIEDINAYAKSHALRSVRVSPELNNVVFSSASMGWCFSLKSMARMYSRDVEGLDVDEFATRLWGNVFYNPITNKFQNKASLGPENTAVRSFVHFILEPLYKIYTHTMSQDEQALKKTLASIGIGLKPAVYKLNVRPLLKTVLQLFFQNSSALVDSALEHVPSAAEGTSTICKQYYTGSQEDVYASSMLACDSDGPLVVHVTKQYSSPDGAEFYCLGRVLSGTIHQGHQVKVLGEQYSLDDEEDMAEKLVDELWIPATRYKVPVNAIPAGNLVLIKGVDGSVVRSATIIDSESREDAYIIKPPSMPEPVVKIAVEPLNPSELPKMLDGLRKVEKTYPLLHTKVEESGEHVILGSGEMYMDCVMHDLRLLFSESEIKVSDPVTRFSETCIERSVFKCYADTPNQKNRLTMIAEPLDKDIASDIEHGKVDIRWPIKKVSKYFQEKHDWDLLASRSIWAFGPDDNGPNILQDDTLPSEVDKRLVNTVRESIRQGFQWATREGPLCEEPVRNTHFKILDVNLAQEPIFRGGGQIIPTARRVCYSSLLLASPRLMEPVFSCHVTCPGSHVNIIYDLLDRRRGNVVSDSPIGGTPLYLVRGVVPVIDSFGLETDIRVATEGQAMVSLVFDEWQLVPGDPLDKDQKTRPLTAATPQALARDFVLKTRRRKGLSEEPTVTKFLDESLVKTLVEANVLNL
uniref:116 kDa U5 small nuclear ribonucleoprotein component n=1 Tax=Blastobotrys adeninivorans TaxID=409370 RepID=A0A060T6H6_BLAAD